MATYFIRITGSDSNAGTTPSAAWRTFGKALGATGISSGDTVYIGAGVYRENNITINMTSATTETSLIGDVNGIMTGDAGEIQYTAYTTNNYTIPPTTTGISLNGRDFLTFKNINFIFGAGGAISCTVLTSTNITFINCFFIAGVNSNNNATGFTATVGGGITANYLFDKCSFVGGNCGIFLTLTTLVGSDYDAGIVVSNCFFLSMSNAVSVTSVGTSANEGGNVILINSTIICSQAMVTTTTRVGGATFTYPCIVKNCFVYARSTTAVNAGELGAIVENYNIFTTAINPRINVLVGPQSVSDNSLAPLFFCGQERIVESYYRPLGMPTKLSPSLSRGDRTVSPINDINNVNYIMGNVNILQQGTITSATENTITDTNKNFGTTSLNGYVVKIVDGLGKNQTKTINGNTNTVISGDGLWITQPNSTSKYIVYQGPVSCTSLVSTGEANTLTDYQASWGINMWQGYQLFIDSGISSGQTFIVSGNSPTVLSGWANWVTIPSSGDAYSLSWGSGTSNSGISYIHAPVGCYTLANNSVKETGIVLSGSNSIRLAGSAYQDFIVAVSGALTIGVSCYFDDYYSGTKPQIILRDCSGVSVPEQTGIMTASSGTWQLISLTSFTPSSNGTVTLRLQSNSTGIGNCYFDAISLV